MARCGRRKSSIVMRKNKSEAVEGAGIGRKVREMTAKAFANEILFEPGRTEPGVRHALALRKYVNRWCLVLEEIYCSLEWGGEQDKEVCWRALKYVDGVVEHGLLPLLQAETVDGVITR